MCHFFYIATAPTAIYTLSLHDALPIFIDEARRRSEWIGVARNQVAAADLCRIEAEAVREQIERALHDEGAHGHPDTAIGAERDRKSTRLNSSHRCISYAVFCLKKKINT